MNELQLTSRGITFRVHDVRPAAAALRECEAQEALRALMNEDRPLEACSDPRQPVVAGFHYHPLMAATHLAFSEHRPLILSPDIIWITIAQGFANHVLLHAEELRERFVSHKGKLTLTVRRDDFAKGSPENPWPEVFSALSAQISEHIGEGICRMMRADFSTTGPVERAASEVVLLEAFRSYFDYVVLCICGIPKITLEGTPADWKSLREKVDYLSEFGLEWWTRHLLPICDQFVRASEGYIDLAHWRNIYKLEHDYGIRWINGWMAKLIPYLKGGAERPNLRNPLLVPAEASPEPQAKGILSSSLPTGLSKVPLLFIQRSPSDGSEQRHPMELIAGLIGITQERGTLALRPKVGWAVRDAERMDIVLEQLKEPHTLYPPLTENERFQAERKLPFLDFSMSRELARFYTQANGADLFPRGQSFTYRIVPFQQLRPLEYKHQIKPPKKPGFEMFGEPISSCPWMRLCLLPDGSCYAARGEWKRTGVEDDSEWIYSGAIPSMDWIFIHTDFEETGRHGKCPVVARSFSALLEHMLVSGDLPFHEKEGFVPMDYVELKPW
jgi:hypothetical protein